MLMPDISQTKQPKEQKKNKLKQKHATFMYNPQNLRICTSTAFFFFQVFVLVKNAKKRRG